MTSLGTEEALCINCQLLPLPLAAGKEAFRVEHYLNALHKNVRDHKYDNALSIPHAEINPFYSVERKINCKYYTAK